ncbi:MAG: hypothetical protein P1U58_14900 [Verrucomicrobiales bacterium]|nr:hypothetical protein [Verrucomicrobiales bacterium]
MALLFSDRERNLVLPKAMKHNSSHNCQSWHAAINMFDRSVAGMVTLIRPLRGFVAFTDF